MIWGVSYLRFVRDFGGAKGALCQKIPTNILSI